MKLVPICGFCRKDDEGRVTDEEKKGVIIQICNTCGEINISSVPELKEDFEKVELLWRIFPSQLRHFRSQIDGLSVEGSSTEISPKDPLRGHILSKENET